MNKKILVVSIILISTIIFSGCGKKQNKIDGDFRRGNIQQNGFTSSTWANMGEKGAIVDLQIGKKVTVMGATNTDGSINANRIMLGEMPKMERPSTTQEQIRDRQNQEMPTGRNNGEQPQFNREGNFPSGERKGLGAGGMSMFQGEILKMDENNFILKTEKEGTKIIYFTPGTEIYIFSSTTPKEITSTTSVE